MYKADAVLGLSNHGGVSIMIDKEDTDYLYYKWYEEEPIRAQITYQPIEGSDNLEAGFEIEGEIYRIDEFMRV